MSDSERNTQPPQGAIRTDREIPEAERKRLEQLTGGDPVRLVADSDLLFSGQYGLTQLLLCEKAIFILEHDRVVNRVLLEDVASAHRREFVGNGVLEVHTPSGQRIELVRYSSTRSESFQEIAERLNRSLHVSEDELEATEDKIAKVAGAREDKPTYRCPNCGHPLTHANDACPKCTSKRQVMLRLMHLMRDHWRLAVLGMVLSLAFTGVSLGPGYLIKELVDKSLRPVEVAGESLLRERGPAGQPDPARLAEARAKQQQGRRYLYGIVAVFLGLILAQALVSHMRIKVMGTLSERLVAELRAKLYRTLQRLSLSYYDREHTGRIMARVLSDTRVVQRFVVQAVQQVVTDILTVIGIAVILFYFNWELAAIALLPIPLVVLCAKIFSRKFRGIYRSVRRKFANLSASVAESISGMRVVKSFAQEEREIDGFNEKNADVYRARISAVMAKSRFSPAIAFMIRLGVLAVWLFGSLEVLDSLDRRQAGLEALSLGTLLMFIGYMNQFYNPVRQLMNLTEAFQESATAAERIFNIMDMPSEVGDHDRAVELRSVKGRIEIRNVSFAYNEGERVLKNINLTIEPGEMIGLVGQTGSGKSTLVSLVCRFYDPTRGQILLDGIDLRDIQTKSLRGAIGMVLQDPFLFAGTIKENIAYGRQDATEAEIIQAAKAANAHDFIMNLPDGYDSEVGERGVMLSGGEKQRISIARAILKDPAILILDEATSAVDTATEAVIQEAMDRLVTGRTTIAIAHRLSTLRNADRLVVLEGGEIIEEGTHQELLEQDGTYARLCRIQAEFATAVGVE